MNTRQTCEWASNQQKPVCSVVTRTRHVAIHVIEFKTCACTPQHNSCGWDAANCLKKVMLLQVDAAGGWMGMWLGWIGPS